MEDLSDRQVMLKSLDALANDTIQTLIEKQLSARTLIIKVKYADFQQVTRSKTFPEPFVAAVPIRPVLAELLAKTDAGKRRVRLLGVGVSNLQPLSAVQNLQQTSLL